VNGKRSMRVATNCLSELTHDREVLFAALTAAGIRKVIVQFDGSGDDGCIGSVEAYAAEDEGETQLPQTPVTIKTIGQRWSSDPCQVNEKTVAMVSDNDDGAIETVCYGYLEQTHGGWEISDGEVDGAYGSFTFNVAEKTITLDFNQRIVDVENSEHEF
jgi:hypothetical protein